jgi:hypothetical protein
MTQWVTKAELYVGSVLWKYWEKTSLYKVLIWNHHIGMGFYDLYKLTS